MMKTWKSFKTISVVLISISMVALLVLMFGCASTNVSLKKNCWGEAISSAISARHEGLPYRIAWDREKAHAWNEVQVNGKWYRTWSNGRYIVDITGHSKYHADKYFDLEQAFTQTFKWKLPTKSQE